MSSNNYKLCSSNTNIILVCIGFIIAWFTLKYHSEKNSSPGDFSGLFLISWLCAMTLCAVFLIPVFNAVGATCYYPFVMPIICLICFLSWMVRYTKFWL